MRIGFTGAGGTGKSTTAMLLSELTGIPIIGSVSRACFKKHGVLTEDDQRDMIPLARWDLQRDIFEGNAGQIKNNSDGIFDRTYVDMLFYAMFRCYDVMTPKEVSFLYSAAKLGMGNFQHIFFCPIYDWKSAIDDSFRTQQLAARTLMNDFIIGFLLRHKIPHTIMQNEPTSIRVDRILKQMGVANVSS